MRFYIIFFLTAFCCLFWQRALSQNNEYHLSEETENSKFFVKAEVWTNNQSGDSIGSIKVKSGEEFIGSTEGNRSSQKIYFYDDDLESGIDFSVPLYVWDRDWDNYIRKTKSVNFSKKEIQSDESKSSEDRRVSVEIEVYRKAEIADFSPKTFCVNNQEYLDVSLESDVNIGDVSGNIIIEKLNNGEGEKYGTGIVSISKDIPVSDIQSNYDIPSGEELKVSFKNDYFEKNNGITSEGGLFILEPPPDFTISVPDIKCHGVEANSIEISGLPYSSDDSKLQINLIKYYDQSSIPDDIELDRSIVYNDETLYWGNQTTTDTIIESGQNEITIDKSELTDDYMNFKSGYYKIEVSYEDGSASSLCFNSDIKFIDEPNSLSLTIEPQTVYDSQYHTDTFGGEGTVVLTASGGRESSNYEYWIKRDDTVGNTVLIENSSSQEETATINNLVHNDTIFLSNDDDCATVYTEVKFEQPDDLEISYGTLEYPTCHVNDGGTKNDGEIPYSVTGGIAPYTVNIKKYDETEGEYTDYKAGQGDNRFTGLENGTYKLTVTDTAGEHSSVELDLFQSNPISTTLAEEDGEVSLDCFGDKDPVELSNYSSENNYTFKYKTKNGQNSEYEEFTYDEENGGVALGNGDYTIKISNTDDCYHEHDLTITQPDSLDIVRNSRSSDICDSSSGVLKFDVNGGTSAYDISLYKNGSFHEKIEDVTNNPITFDSLKALRSDNSNNVYKAIVTDGNSCSDTIYNEIVPFSNPIDTISLDLIKEESCANKNDAEIKINNWDSSDADSPLKNFSFKISEKEYDISDNGVVSGLTETDSAFIRIEDGMERGCVYDTTIDIESLADSDQVQFNSHSVTPASCNTASDGSINVEGARGPDGGYKFKIDEQNYTEEYKSQSHSFDGLSPGTHTVSIMDAAGCEVSEDITVSHGENPISVGNIRVAPALCANASDGAITVKNIQHEDEGLMKFSWNDTPVDSIGSMEELSFKGSYNSGLSPGIYSLKFTDDNNCSFEEIIEVGHEGYQPDFSQSIEEKVACPGKDNGQVSFKLGDGKADDFEYKVFEGNGLNGSPLKTGESKTDTLFRIGRLTNKKYSVQVTDSKGCGDTLEVDMPLIKNPLEISEKNITPASCDEIGNGVLEVKAEGGYLLKDDRYIFSYEKTPSNSQDKIAVSDTTDALELDSLFHGDEIEFSVKDKYGCRVNGDFITVDVKDDFTRIEKVIRTHPACHNDSTGELTPQMQWTPGTTDYEYSLYTVDDSFNHTDTVSGELKQNDLSLEGLTAGTYDLEVVDGDGCRDVYQGLNLKDPDAVSVDVDHNYIRAKDEETGRFELTITGGNQKYEVGWAPDTGDDIFSDVDTITSSSFEIDGLPGGSYRVAVRDTANCPYFNGESWFTRDITIPEPEKPLNISRDTVIDVSCNKLSDGRVEVEADGGWGPGYMYSLNGGEPQNSAVFDRLKAGEYSVLVTDTAGVSDSLSLEVTQPDTLNVFVDEVRDATCPRYANGVVEVTVLNGIKDEDGLRYFVEDTAGPSEIYGETYSDRSYQFDRLPEGNYEIFVEDANGCVASKPFSVQEPDTAVISIENNYIRAKGESTGTISAAVKHGNGVFDYRWFYDDGPFEKDTTHGNLELDSLAGGEYTLMVRDTAGCVYEEDEWMERHIDIREPEKSLGFDVAENRAVSCYGEEDGLLRIAPDGGWGDYRLRLGDGEFVSSRVFDGLEKNKYAISVKDSAGIVYSDSIEVTQPDPLQATVSSTEDVNCYNGNDGAINLEISGGNLSYLVSPDGEEWQEGTTVNGLTKGSYSAHVKDTLGCSLVLESVEINQPDKIVLSDSSIVESRCGNDEGAIKAEYEGGVGDYSYQWFKVASKAEGQQEQMVMEDENRSNIDELYAGRYQAVVTDGHDCRRSFEYRVSDIADLTIDSIKTTGVVCPGDSNGRAEAFVSKGNPEYSYAWADEVGTSDQEEAAEIPAGKHWLEVSDEKGCLVFRDFTIETPEPLTYDTLNLKQPLCLGGEKGKIELEGKGGTPGYGYRWTDGVSGTVREGVEPGAYEFTLIDSRDCRARFSLDMDWQRELQPDIGRDTTICHYDVLTLDGGDYENYQWNIDGDDVGSSRRFDADIPGQYSLRVRDEDQCLGYDTLSLDVSKLKIRDIETTAVSCANAGDGKAEISIASNDDNYAISRPDDSEENVWENLSGGNYHVKVDNPYGCIAERDFTIDEPAPLSLTTSLSHPLCHGVHDGRIQVSASGGNRSYSYRWQHGPEQSSLRGLDEGGYGLTVTDAKGCTLSDRYELNYQRSLQPDLGSDLALCSKAAAYVTPGTFHSYKWSRDGEKVEGDSLLEVDGPGDYVVEVSDEDGCLAFDSIRATEISSDLSPQFLSASAIPKGDTLMVVDVTKPKPSGLEWSFSGKYEIIDTGDYFCEVVFEDEGMHTATLTALLDNCMGMNRKQILVTPENDQNNPENTYKEGGSSLFNSMTVAPNPTEGAFTVELEMKETATVNLYLVRIETGQVYVQKQLSGFDYYQESFNVSGSGRYVLFAECTGDRLMRKVLVR